MMLISWGWLGMWDLLVERMGLTLMWRLDHSMEIGLDLLLLLLDRWLFDHELLLLRCHLYMIFLLYEVLLLLSNNPVCRVNSNWCVIRWYKWLFKLRAIQTLVIIFHLRGLNSTYSRWFNRFDSYYTHRLHSRAQLLLLASRTGLFRCTRIGLRHLLIIHPSLGSWLIIRICVVLISLWLIWMMIVMVMMMVVLEGYLLVLELYHNGFVYYNRGWSDLLRLLRWDALLIQKLLMVLLIATWIIAMILLVLVPIV